MAKTSGSVRKGGKQSSREPNYSDQDRQILGFYQGAGYGLMNDSLRSGNITSGVARLDAAVAKDVMHKGTTVYRGVTNIEQVLGMQIKDPKKLVGKTFKEKAFMSVSTSKEVATSFAKGSDGSSAVFRITVPKGVQFADLSKVASTGIDAKEKEYLLRRGLSIKITDVRIKQGRYYITATIKK